MNCNEFLAQLHDHFLGRLADGRMAEIDAHAAGCTSCGALMALAKELSCRDFTEFLDDYVEDTLDPERKAVFERHIAICTDCRNYLSSYRATMRASQLAFRDTVEPVPASIPEELLRAILKAGPKRSRPARDETG